jgi:membrane protein required for colicin V production
MTPLDVIVLLLVGGGALLGMSRGFVTETLSLGAWVAAILAVKLLHGPVALALESSVGTSAGASVLSFALIFGLTMLVGRMVARKIGDQTKKSVMGAFDRVLGFGFGAVKGLLGASIAFLLFSLMYDTVYGRQSDRPDWMMASKSYPLLNASSRALVNFVEERRNGGEESTKGAT